MRLPPDRVLSFPLAQSCQLFSQSNAVVAACPVALSALWAKAVRLFQENSYRLVFVNWR
ncbi:MAG TPA: hypothetical protein VKB88_08080 [Bryobacteraceae bacterium]|nr:hypothetical protein [Bryobacteraceae bacterium]